MSSVANNSAARRHARQLLPTRAPVETFVFPVLVGIESRADPATLQILINGEDVTAWAA